MLIDYPTEWEHFMINGKIRTFSKSTPKEIIEKAKEINKTAIRTGGKPAFFFESTDENDGQELINSMLKGNIAAIKKGIASDSILLKIDAIVRAVKSKISDKEIFYLMSRGLSEEDAKAMIVRGFAYPISKELPVEYAVEMNNLINLELEGAIG